MEEAGVARPHVNHLRFVTNRSARIIRTVGPRLDGCVELQTLRLLKQLGPVPGDVDRQLTQHWLEVGATCGNS